MRNWRAIRRDIYDALADYDVYDVEYDGTGDCECSAFYITIDSDEDPESAVDDLDWVLNDYDLSVDNWYSDEDGDWIIQLNAYWDT